MCQPSIPRRNRPSHLDGRQGAIAERLMRGGGPAARWLVVRGGGGVGDDDVDSVGAEGWIDRAEEVGENSVGGASDVAGDLVQILAVRSHEMEYGAGTGVAIANQL